MGSIVQGSGLRVRGGHCVLEKGAVARNKPMFMVFF